MTGRSPGESASRAKAALTDSPFPFCALSTSVISAGHITPDICGIGPYKARTSTLQGVLTWA